MRYKISSGVEIRTENAAKPASQPSQFLVDLISGLPHVSMTFDYGCGKLRYVKAISSKTDTLTLIDSEIQLSRLQMLGNKETSIRNIFKQSNRVAILNEVEFAELSSEFD
jgi:hypothetical protein